MTMSKQAKVKITKLKVQWFQCSVSQNIILIEKITLL